MSNLSLMHIMRDDPDFGKRLTKKTQEIKQDKAHLSAAAEEYHAKYREEIQAGTQKRAKLLSEGASRGLSKEEVIHQNGFIPTVHTPLLNLLYFMLRESSGQDQERYRRRDAINECLVKAGQLSHDNDERDISASELTELLDAKMKEISAETFTSSERSKLNQQFQYEQRSRPKEDEVAMKQPQEMVEYLYGNVTLDMFDKIKKLKALSRSENKHEAFLAYTKGMELCKEHGLDFDKIPCYVKGQ